MRKFLSVFFLFFYCFYVSAGPDGGVIGNARIDFKNLLIGVKGSVPESWNSLDFGTLVSLTSNDEVNKNFVTLALEQEEDVTNAQELEKYVENKNPHGQWEKITLDGHDGFESLLDEKAEVYFLGKNKDVLTIRYDKKNDGGEIKSILESLSFIP